jgi:hypothetical protein
MGNRCSPCKESLANDISSFHLVAEELDSEVLAGMSQDTASQSALENIDKFPHLLGQRTVDVGTSIQLEKRRLQIERNTVSELEAFVQRRRLEIEQETKRLEEILLLDASVANQRLALEQDTKGLFGAKAKLDSIRKNCGGVQTNEKTISEIERITQVEVSKITDLSPQQIAENDQCAELLETKFKRPSNNQCRTPFTTVSFQSDVDDTVRHAASTRSRSTPGSFSLDSARDVPKFSARSNQSASATLRLSSRRSGDSQPALFTRRGIEIVFSDQDGDERTIYMTQRPLGAKFAAAHAHGRRVKVSHVSRSSHADELGIEEGWLVDKVAGQDVFGKSFEEVQAALKDRTAHLPLNA